MLLTLGSGTSLVERVNRNWDEKRLTVPVSPPKHCGPHVHGNRPELSQSPNSNICAFLNSRTLYKSSHIEPPQHADCSGSVCARDARPVQPKCEHDAFLSRPGGCLVGWHDCRKPRTVSQHCSTYTRSITDKRRLTTGILSEKCVVRRFRPSANVIQGCWYILSPTSFAMHFVWRWEYFVWC